MRAESEKSYEENDGGYGELKKVTKYKPAVITLPRLLVINLLLLLHVIHY